MSSNVQFTKKRRSGGSEASQAEYSNETETMRNPSWHTGATLLKIGLTEYGSLNLPLAALALLALHETSVIERISQFACNALSA
jgi:hypothetical protein